jgi:conjugative transposon TraM protein
MYREDPEVIALQEQLRQNQRADSLKAAAAMKRRTAKARPKKETPKKEEPERTVGRFFSGEEPENKGNTIEAIVSGDQKITNGSVIKLVTLQEMQLPGGMVINKGTAVFGVVKLAQDRINITVESVRIGNSIYEMQKTVYDRDGLPGIYVPLNIKAEATKEAADEVVSDMNVTSYGTDVLSTGVNAVSNAAKSVFRKKNNQVVVTVKSNYKLYLK